MADVDLSKIKHGDEVKIEFRGLTGWQCVEGTGLNGKNLRLQPMSIRFDPDRDDLVVLEHKPAPVKIEVELPEPGRWQFEEVWTDHHCTGIGVNAPDTFLGVKHAEEFALAILSLVHEARS